MYDPQTETLKEITPEYLAANPEIRKKFPIFKQGDVVLVKNQVDLARPYKAKFRIEQIGNGRMTLVAVGEPK